MAQRLIRGHKNLFIKLVEIFTGIFVAVLFTLLLNKYILVGAKNIINHYQIRKNSENELDRNFKYKKRQNNNHDFNNHKIIVKLCKEGNSWKLSDNSTGYEVGFNSEGKIQIKGNSKFSVKVNEIKENYYDVNGVVNLDIPKEGKEFVIYEQEDAIPIFGYHYVVDDNVKIKNPTLEMHESDFDKQIKYLSNGLGCRWFTFGDIMENYVLKNKKIPKRACVLNFDDGKKDSYYKILPILHKYNAVATFYIITHMVGKPAYMTWSQLDQIYQVGNEIGAHTLFGGSLVHTDWFEKKIGRKFTDEDLTSQIRDSKTELESRGYVVKTFAYPLGEWNNKIEHIVMKNYIAARDIARIHPSLDMKTPTVSFNKSFIWHMHYNPIELDDDKTIKYEMGYNNWWQFEDGYRILSENKSSVRELSSLADLTECTYHMVDLRDKGDRIINKFIVSHNGIYDIEFFGSTGEKDRGKYFFLNNIDIFVDNKKINLKKGHQQDCKIYNNIYYCNYFVKNVELSEGLHTVSVRNNSTKFLRLDKFRIFRKFKTKNSYEIEIIN